LTDEVAVPGVSIKSAWYTSTTATNTISGTSMATPHTAGVGALYLEANPGATPAQVRDAIFANTTKDIVTSSSTANNDLLYMGFITGGGGGPVPDPPASGTFSLTLSGSSTNQSSSWTVIVTISATDSLGGPVAGVTASGSWSNGGTVSCMTNSSGTCTVSRSQHKKVGSVTFTVSRATHSTLTYDGGPDSVTVLKP